MNAIKAIFGKQLADLPKNLSVTTMFILFPLMSLLLGGVMGGDDPIGSTIMNVQFMMMFVGMTPMIMIANTIAEDNEYKSLRFMVTAGVKPVQYLLGLVLFAMIASAAAILAFAIIGGHRGQELVFFIALGLTGALASCMLGAIVGLFSKNVQQSSAIYTPIGMALAFAPFLALNLENIRQIVQPLFTVQIFVALVDMVLPDFAPVLNRLEYEGYHYTERFIGQYIMEPIEPLSSGMAVSLAIIGANVVVFAVLFVIAYRRKGLKG